MTYTRVQAAANGAIGIDNTSELDVTLGSPVTSGHLLVAWWISGQVCMPRAANTGWVSNASSAVLQAVSATVYWKVAGGGEPQTWGVVPAGLNAFIVAGYHEYAGNASVPFDAAAFASVYQDTGAVSGPAVTAALGANHELLFVLEALRLIAPGTDVVSGVSWSASLASLSVTSDGATPQGLWALAADLLDSGTSSSITTQPIWSGASLQQRTTIAVSFMSVTGSGVPVASSDAGSGAEAGVAPAAQLADSDQVAFPSFDVGEQVIQTGPFGAGRGDTGAAAEAASFGIAAADTGAGADAGGAAVVLPHFVSSSDGTIKPITNAKSDADHSAAGAAETGLITHVTLADADYGSGVDGA